MKLRAAARRNESVKLQMTSMIDIVFLLLVFFVMTFQVVLPEGDFEVAMAEQGAQGRLPPYEIPLTLELTADDAGRLAGIRLNGRSFASLAELNEFLAAYLAARGDERPPELEIRADYGLNYEHVVAALTAVRGRRTSRGVEEFVSDIRFAPPGQPPGK